MAAIEILNPPEMGTALGPYSQIAKVKAREFVMISGQVGVDPGTGRVGATFQEQCELLYANVGAALKAAGAGWVDVVQFTSYLINADDISGYMDFRAKAYPVFFPDRVYPTHTLLIVNRLVKEGLMVEVTATAALG